MSFTRILRPFSARIQCIILCIFFSNAMVMVMPWGIKMIVDGLQARGGIEVINWVVGVILAATIIRGILNYLKNVFSHSVGEQLICRMREEIYDHVHQLPLAELQRITPSRILTRLTGDLDNLRRFLFCDIVEFIYGALSILLIFSILMIINARLTLAALLFYPVFLVMYFRRMPLLKQHYRGIREHWGEISSRINEVIQGMPTVRSCGAYRHEMARLSERHGNLIEDSMQAHRLNIRLGGLAEFASTLGILTVLWLGSRDVLAQRMTVGELIAFYSYIGMLFAPLIRMVMINTSYQEASAALDRINHILECDRLADAAKPLEDDYRSGGRVVFDSVSFGYDPPVNVVENLNFCIQPGENVGIVGVSGAGKSTLINLLLGFYRPQSGKILLDGRTIEDMGAATYRQQMAVVLQDSYMFSGTIRENIAYGRPEADFLEIQMVAEIAQIDDYIRSLPQGYETKVGERGLNLSGGQRQRMAIARALLRNPTVLILDEATSALDAMTENRVQQALSRYMRGKTMITVAHRYSTIIETDRIMVIDRGQIVENGTHDQLFGLKGIYYKIYSEQFKDNDIPVPS